jgi:hypothetical protein
MLQKGIPKVAILNWRQVTQNRDGWRRVTREVDSGATEEEE